MNHESARRATAVFAPSPSTTADQEGSSSSAKLARVHSRIRRRSSVAGPGILHGSESSDADLEGIEGADPLLLSTDPNLRFIAKKSKLMRKASAIVSEKIRRRSSNGNAIVTAQATAGAPSDTTAVIAQLPPALSYDERRPSDASGQHLQEDDVDSGNVSDFDDAKASAVALRPRADTVVAVVQPVDSDAFGAHEATEYYIAANNVAKSSSSLIISNNTSCSGGGSEPVPQQRKSVNFVTDASEVADVKRQRNANGESDDDERVLQRTSSSVQDRIEEVKLRRAVHFIGYMYTKLARQQARENRRHEAQLEAQRAANASNGNRFSADEAWLTIACAVNFFDVSFSNMARRISARRQLGVLLVPLVRRALLRRRKRQYVEFVTSRDRGADRVVAPGTIELARASPVFSKCGVDLLVPLVEAATPVCFFANECVVFAGEEARRGHVLIIASGQLEEVHGRKQRSNSLLFHRSELSPNSMASGATSPLAAATRSHAGLPGPLMPQALVTGGMDTASASRISTPSTPSLALANSARSYGNGSVTATLGAQPSPTSRSLSPASVVAPGASSDDVGSLATTAQSVTFARPPPMPGFLPQAAVASAGPLSNADPSELSFLHGTPVQALESYTRGGVIGDVRVILGETFLHTVRCATDVVAYVVPAPAFLAFIEALPHAAHVEALHASKNDARKRVLKWHQRPTVDELMAGSELLAQCPREAVGQMAVCLTPAVARPGERIVRDIYTAERVVVVQSGRTRLVEELPLEQVVARKMRFEVKPPSSQGGSRSGGRSLLASRGGGSGSGVGAGGVSNPLRGNSPSNVALTTPPSAAGAASRGRTRSTSIVAASSPQSQPNSPRGAGGIATRRRSVGSTGSGGGSNSGPQPATPSVSGPTTLRILRPNEVVGLESLCMLRLPPSNGNDVSLIADTFTVVWVVPREEVQAVTTRMELNARLSINASRQINVPPVTPQLLQSAQLFSFLTDKVAQRIAETLTVRVLIPGIVFVREGMLMTEAFIVVAGVVQLCVQERRAVGGGLDLTAASSGAGIAGGFRGSGGGGGGGSGGGTGDSTAKKAIVTRRVVSELTRGQFFGFPELLAQHTSPYTLVCPHSAVVMVATRGDVLAAVGHGRNHNLMLSIIERAELISGVRNTSDSQQAKLESAIVAENQQRADDKKLIDEAQKRCAERAAKALKEKREREEESRPLRQETIDRFMFFRQRALQLQQLTVEHRVFASFQKQLFGNAKTKDELVHDEYFARPFDRVRPLFYDHNGDVIEGTLADVAMLPESSATADGNLAMTTVTSVASSQSLQPSASGSLKPTQSSAKRQRKQVQRDPQRDRYVSGRMHERPLTPSSASQSSGSSRSPSRSRVTLHSSSTAATPSVASMRQPPVSSKASNSHFTLDDTGSLVWVRDDTSESTSARSRKRDCGPSSNGREQPKRHTSGPSRQTLVEHENTGYNASTATYDPLHNPMARLQRPVAEPPVLYPQDAPKAEVVIDTVMREWKATKRQRDVDPGAADPHSKVESPTRNVDDLNTEAVRSLLNLQNMHLNPRAQLTGQFQVGSRSADMTFLVAGQRRLVDLPRDGEGKPVIGSQNAEEIVAALGEAIPARRVGDSDIITASAFPELHHAPTDVGHQRQFHVTRGQLSSTHHKLELLQRQADAALEGTEPLSRRDRAAILREGFHFEDHSKRRPLPMTARTASLKVTAAAAAGSNDSSPSDQVVAVAPLTCRAEYVRQPFKHNVAAHARRPNASTLQEHRLAARQEAKRDLVIREWSNNNEQHATSGRAHPSVVTGATTAITAERLAREHQAAQTAVAAAAHAKEAAMLHRLQRIIEASENNDIVTRQALVDNRAIAVFTANTDRPQPDAGSAAATSPRALHPFADSVARHRGGGDRK